MADIQENFTIENGVKEIIIRRGDVLPPTPDPIPLKLSGLLINPSQYLHARRNLLDKDKCNLVVNKNEGELKFTINERVKYSDVISGKITYSKIYESFRINESAYWGDKELAKFFRRNQYYFADRQSFETVYKALMNFQAKVNANIEKNADLKGNLKVAFERTVDSNVPDSFFLQVPIFQGYEPVVFEVFIGAEANNSEVKFFLESPVLYEIIEKEKEAILIENIKHFEEFGCAIMYV